MHGRVDGRGEGNVRSESCGGVGKAHSTAQSGTSFTQCIATLLPLTPYHPLSPPLISSHPLYPFPTPHCLRCQPSFASDLTLQLLQDGVEIAAAQTRATVPVGQTQFVYRSKEALSVGGRVQCSFTVRRTRNSSSSSSDERGGGGRN